VTLFRYARAEAIEAHARANFVTPLRAAARRRRAFAWADQL
jgi:hypothetical protein